MILNPLPIYTWKANYIASMPLHEQLKNKIHLSIETGQLKSGSFLPSAKKLSEELNISVATSQRAYKQVMDEGCLAFVKGKGYMVFMTQKTAVL